MVASLYLCSPRMAFPCRLFCLNLLTSSRKAPEQLILHNLSLLWSSRVKQSRGLWAQSESHRENHWTLSWARLKGSFCNLQGNFTEQRQYPGPILEPLYQITEERAQVLVFLKTHLYQSREPLSNLPRPPGTLHTFGQVVCCTAPEGTIHP